MAGQCAPGKSRSPLSGRAYSCIVFIIIAHMWHSRSPFNLLPTRRSSPLINMHTIILVEMSLWLIVWQPLVAI